MEKLLTFIIALSLLTLCVNSSSLFSNSANLSSENGPGPNLIALTSTNENVENIQMDGSWNFSTTEVGATELGKNLKSEDDDGNSYSGNETTSPQKTEQTGWDVLFQVVFSKTGAIVFGLVMLVLICILMPSCCDFFEYYGSKKRTEALNTQEVLEDTVETEAPPKVNMQHFEEANGNYQGTAV